MPPGPIKLRAKDLGMMNTHIAKEFENELPGRVLTAQSADFDRVRQIFNGMIDRRPLLIVRCRSTNDVAAAVRLSSAHNIPTSIRGGGHNFAGKSILDGGVMIDLSEMKGITVDSARRS